MNRLLRPIVYILAPLFLLSSCGSTSEGVFTGMSFGGMIGSAIGGISGGWRGHDAGLLIGMAAGGVAGAAVANAAQQQDREYVRSHYASLRKSGVEYTENSVPEYQRSETPQYDDRIVMQTDSAVTDKTFSADATTANEGYSIVIENVEFIGVDGKDYIDKGDLCRIAFDIRNVTDGIFYNVVPSVEETTKNKRVLVSPNITLEQLGPHKALRYTAFVSAQKNLKEGTAHFKLTVLSAGVLLSNTVEFTIPLTDER